jgi:hypothetical protein
MSWKGERGLGWPAGGVGGHYKLERGGGHFFVCDRFIIRKVWYQKGSVSDRFSI